MLKNNDTQYGNCTYTSKEQLVGFQYFKDERHIVKPLFVSVAALVLAPVIVFGNVLIVWGILRRPSLRTPANLLICFLSCLDALVGVLYLPSCALWAMDYSPDSSCVLFVLKLVFGWGFCSASFFAMTAASCERYLALFHPLRYPTIVTKRRLLLLFAFIGLVSLVLCSFIFIQSITRMLRYAVGSILIGNGLIIIFGTYTRIFKLVRRHQHQINAQNMTDTNNARQRKLAVTMAFVIGVSLLCYLPLGIVLVHVVIQGGYTVQNTGFFVLGEWLFSTSSLVNPLIYCLKNEEIRGAVMQLVRDIRNKCK